MYSVDPGFSATNLFDRLPWWFQAMINNPLFYAIMRPVPEAAASVLHAVLAPADDYDSADNYLYDGHVKVPRCSALIRADSQQLWQETSRILDLNIMRDM